MPAIEYRDIAATVQLLIIIGGWFFIARDNDRRERRKELRLTLNELIKQVHNLEFEAIAYFGAPNDDGEALRTANLQRGLKRLGLSLQRLRDLNPDLVVTPQLVRFRHRMTYYDFGAADRVPWHVNDAQLQEIMIAGHELAAVMDKWFYSKYDR